MTPEQRATMNPYTNGLPDDVAQKHAERYRQAFEMFLRHKDVIGRVTCGAWMMAIRGSIIFRFADAPIIRCLFDRQGKPKPAFFAVQKVAANDGIQPDTNVAPAAARRLSKTRAQLRHVRLISAPTTKRLIRPHPPVSM